ncbi:hypothetical protein GH5_01928 [Leishmania sp. Ghana 2012 LV757]|uniref:hypothetical protein n=1 Tax=Leishmania sp. Ghana 2012 LV757 TaxID=2803181 RepID=UPI001B48ACF7|nr:hypothetical protein GH5_01928 [Leishmania sp. Ghana 2012 LV757]
MPHDARLPPYSSVQIEAAVAAQQWQRRARKRSGIRSGPLARLLLVLFTAALALSSVCLSQTPSTPLNSAGGIAVVEPHSEVPSERSVALRYTFPGSSLALLVTGNGLLHAYDLERGRHVWSADAGGDMLTVTINQPPSKETALRDPLALPFLVRGNSLFTRIPFFTFNPLETTDATERLDGLPPSLRPYFFMNISTLLRRQTLFLDGTDVYVTTSIHVANLDASTGRPVQSREAGSQAFCSSTNTSTPSTGDCTTQPQSLPHNELLPLLHTVRYNIALHAVRAGEYNWSISLSQLRLSPHAVAQPSFPLNFSADTTADTWSSAPRDGDNDEAPRFFSQFMRSMFDYDEKHATHVAFKGAGEQRAESAPARQTSTTLLMSNLQRTRTQAAESISKMLGVQQINASHVSLRSIHNGTTAWTSTLPNVSCEALSEGTAPCASSSNTTSIVSAAYVWVSGADEIFRVPVRRPPLGSVGEEDKRFSVYMEADTNVGAARRPPRLTSASLAGALVPTRHAAGERNLVPLLVDGGVGFSSSRDNSAGGEWAFDDVEADEREETELAAYYHQCPWWEPPFLSSLSMPGTVNGADGVGAIEGMGPSTSSRAMANSNGVYSSENTPLAFGTPGAVVKTGLAWRTAAVISFQVLCLAGSIAFLCAGVPPRGQLQRAWAQADRNRDRVSHKSSSHQQSARLLPQDLLSPPGGRSTPFSLILDSLSMDPLGFGGLPAGSISLATVSLPRSDDSLQELMRYHQLGHLNRSPPRSPRVHSPPELVRATLCEDSEKDTLPVTPTAATTATKGTATSSKAGFGVTSSTTSDRVQQAVMPVKKTATSSSSPIGTARGKQPAMSASNGSSDDDTIDIDLGERWWLRAQFPPRQLPSAPTLDETLSERGSSFSRSQANTGTEEEGKLFQLHFKVLEKVGFGGEGSVFCVEHRVTHARYAIKVIHIHEQDEERVVQEAVLHSSFDNANVVRFYFCWIEDISVSTANRLQLCRCDEDGLDTASMTFSDNSLMMSASDKTNGHSTDVDTDSLAGDTYHMLFIQMEYFPLGTLADWLRRRTGFFRLEVLRYMKQIGEGLAYLHNQDVVHRDLKPTNIFVSNDNVLKIGDFGLAKRPGNAAAGTGDLTSNVVGGHQERSVVGGSPLYSSPEQTRGEPVNKPSDIFSLGIIAVEMLCTFTTLHERIRILTNAHQLILPEELEAEFPDEVQLIKSMLAANPLQRPPIRKLLRQINKLIVTLEAQESDEEAGKAPPQSPPDGAEHVASRNGSYEATNAAFGNDCAPARSAATAANEADHKTLQACVTSPRRSAVRPATKDLSSSGLIGSLLGPDDSLLPSVCRQSADADLPLVWHSEAGSSTGVSATATSATILSANDNNVSSLGPRVADRGSSVVSASASTMVKRGNTYHRRRPAPASSSTEAETARLQTSLLVTTGFSSRQELVNNPYGLPTTPVMYTGDADLPSILKRDLQDRTVSAPD